MMKMMMMMMMMRKMSVVMMMMMVIVMAVCKAFPEKTSIEDFLQHFETIEVRADVGDSDILCNNDKVDIGFIIDTSRSIHENDYNLQIKFIMKLISIFDIGPENIRVAAISFGQVVIRDSAFGFSKYKTKEKVLAGIEGIVYRGKDMGDKTETAVAIDFARNNVFSNKRPGVKQICIVFTDGKSTYTEQTKQKASLARKDGIKMIAIGIGKNVSMEELNAIASSRDLVFKIDSYQQLPLFKTNITTKICKSPISMKHTTTPSPDLEDPIPMKHTTTPSPDLEGPISMKHTTTPSPDLEGPISMKHTTTPSPDLEGPISMKHTTTPSPDLEGPISMKHTTTPSPDLEGPISMKHTTTPSPDLEGPISMKHTTTPSPDLEGPISMKHTTTPSPDLEGPISMKHTTTPSPDLEGPISMKHTTTPSPDLEGPISMKHTTTPSPDLEDKIVIRPNSDNSPRPPLSDEHSCKDQRFDINIMFQPSRIPPHYVMELIDNVIGANFMDEGLVRVGVIAIPKSNFKGFRLNQYQSKIEITEHFRTYHSTFILTPSLLDMRARAFHKLNGGRSDARKIGILLIDEKITDIESAVEEAKYAHVDGIEMFVISKGSQNADDAIMGLVDNKRNRIEHASFFSDLRSVADRLFRNMC